MSLFDWIRSKVNPEPDEPVDSEPASGAPSTHEYDTAGRRLPAIAARAWRNFTTQWAAAIPTFSRPVGAAMDAEEDSDGMNSLKRNYQLAQPNISEALLLWYVSQGFIGHQMCAILAQHWLIDKACSMPAEDAIRQGYDIVSANGGELAPEIKKAIEQYDEAFSLNAHMQDHVHRGRIFGIRIAFFKIDSPDPKYYEKPFNLDGVRPNSYRGIVQVDPYWTAPVLDEEAAAHPDSLHFYEPTWWIINGKKYHRTHLIIFRTRKLPDFMAPSYIYSGVPIPQQIMERVYAAERTANEGPLLAMSKRTTGFGTNTKKAFANKEQFDTRMSEWIEFRDNTAVKIYDKSEDELVQFDTTLADLDKIIMNQYQLVAAASRVPATKLLGTQPTGFNSTGDYEEASYHEELESIQTHKLNPLMHRHHQILVRSYIVPKFGVDIEVRGEWNPLDSPTAVEEADINLKKAQTDAALVQAGAIDGVDVNERIRMDKKSGYTGIAAGIRAEPEKPDDTDPNPDVAGGT